MSPVFAGRIQIGIARVSPAEIIIVKCNLGGNGAEEMRVFLFFCNAVQNDVAKARAGKTVKGGTAIHSKQTESLRGRANDYSAHSTLKSRIPHHTRTQLSY